MLSNFIFIEDTIFVTGGTGHTRTELLSLSTWSWETRAPCPLSKLDRMPSLYINNSFYVFGQKTESRDVTTSVVARFDPFENEWTELGGYGQQSERFAVVSTSHGVVIVDAGRANTKLCQIRDFSVDCEYMERSDPELTISNGEIIMFTFDHTQCPRSVELPATGMGTDF